MRILLSTLLLPLLLNGEMTSSSISSKKASYDGDALILKGDVNLNHALGKMVSGSARLEKEEKEGPFSSIFLRDQVLITLKNLGKVSCAKADFNFVTMTGKLLPEVGKLIQFINLDPNLFSLSSREANMELAKEADSIKILKINAEGDVHVEYGNDFLLDADQATYSNDAVPYLSASPNCKLSHLEDTVHAEKVEFFPNSSKAILNSPKGIIKPSAFSAGQGMQFSCQRMIWENNPQILTLQGDVSVIDETVGTFQCEDQVELRQKQQEGKWILSSLVAKGKTSLTYELNADFKHLLICYGLMHLDDHKLTLTLESPENHPIEYFHDQMKLNSDHALIEYLKNEEKVEVDKLLLNGNVRLSVLENGSRCATADQFVYFPAEEKMVLSAQDGKNVLFWDKEQDLSISAREIHIDRLDKKEIVKGVGNVRFAFSSSENSLLKKLFPFYEPEGGQ